MKQTAGSWKRSNKTLSLESDLAKAGCGGDGCRSIKSRMKKKLQLTEKYKVS